MMQQPSLNLSGGVDGPGARDAVGDVIVQLLCKQVTTRFYAMARPISPGQFGHLDSANGEVGSRHGVRRAHRSSSERRLPPHFHAYYGNDAAKIDIETLHVSEGKLRRRPLALVLAWAVEHRDELREN